MEKRWHRPLRSARPPGARSILLCAGLSALAAAGLSLSKPAALNVDGRRMLSDVPPVTTPHGTYVPLRIVAESLGAQTSYDSKTGMIELVHAGDVMRLRNGDRVATFDGKKVVLGRAPFEDRGRIMVALGTIARVFNTRVSYDPVRSNIEVTEPGAEPAGADQDQ